MIDTLVFVFPCEGRATTVGGTPSASADSAACSGSATAEFPVDKKARPLLLSLLFIYLKTHQNARNIPSASRHPGARCKVDKDCGASMCCARHHGEQVCKRRLVRGESCYVPDGGLAFSINQICPCDEGLLCREHGASHQRE